VENLNKKIILGHGDKGGVGKSVLIALCVDYLLGQGPVCVVEGDSKIDDIAARFGGIDGVIGIGADLYRPDKSEEAIIGVFDALEKSGLPDTVVINTPANASATLDKQARVFIDAAHDLGYEVRVGWMVGPDADSAALSASSALCALADRKVAVVNARLGDPSKFLWARHKARTSWIESGGLEAVLPQLTDTAMNAVRENMGRYTDLSEPGSPLSTITRKYVKDWCRKAFEGPVGMLLDD
jgi:hypothetical protein